VAVIHRLGANCPSAWPATAACHAGRARPQALSGRDPRRWWRDRAGAGCRRVGLLMSAGRRVVLLQHAGRDAAALTNRDAVFFRPGRISPGRRRLAAAPDGRRGCPRPALRACSMNGASFLRNAVAFLLLRSISYSAPPKANRMVSSAGPPRMRTTGSGMSMASNTGRNWPGLARTVPTISSERPTERLQLGDERMHDRTVHLDVESFSSGRGQPS
jgi:hypothetical protein